METQIPERTKHGIIEGRDALFLEKIIMHDETCLEIQGEINTRGGQDENYKITFNNIVYLRMVEIDFSSWSGGGGSFGIVKNSEILENFRNLDHSAKLTNEHRHFYFRTYDTVFEVIAFSYELEFSPI